ncbi:MAG: non-ribosomal peptide synthetase [Chromatiales bacterium]|nr:non-ribosomal peptide synthetase [Chromatiales bacterium]
MSALELIARLREAGIRLRVSDGKIRLKAEKGALTDELRTEIARYKQDIVALLDKESGKAEPKLKALSRSGPLPLSYAQQRLWFLDELEPGTPVYNMPFALRVRGKLNVDALQTALNELVKRHETLRTVFSAGDEDPAQEILDTIATPLHIESQPGHDEPTLTERLRELACESFDLSKGPLLRLHVIELSAEEHVLLLVIHHIISDLWSMNVFFNDLGLMYERQIADVTPEPDELPVQYADYAAWQREQLAGPRLERQLEYWLQTLGNAPPVLELATDRPRPPEPGYAGKWLARKLDADLTSQLQALAKSSGCTLFMLTFAAFIALLQRYSGEQDLVVGTPISGRQRTELEGLIGFFLNTLALRIDTTDDPTFADLLERVKQTALAGYANQDLPFEKLVEELQPERDMSHTPVFQHMFIWQEGSGKQLSLAGLETEPAELISHDTAKFDLTLAMTGAGDAIEAGFEYNTDLFDAASIERMLSHLEALLKTVSTKPGTRLSELGLLTDVERRQVIQAFNSSAADFGEAVCVHQLVEAQVQATPNQIAVELKGRHFSYAELNRRANLLAGRLIELGAAPGTRVAISCTRSLDLPVAALAVLKSGACYVAVDPAYPAERIAAMLADSSPQVVICQSGAELPAGNGETLVIDTFDFEGDAANPETDVVPADPLYCIYTSGSTGIPKGVQLSHGGLANLLRWQQQHARLAIPAKTLQFASFSFDVSFQELFATWAQGGTLVMVDEELRQDLPALAGFITEQQIERLYLPFAALQPIAETIVRDGLQPALRDIIVAGEQLQVTDEVRALFGKLSGAALHNQYGPSETHVVTALTLTGDARGWPYLPPIGTPVANTQAYILDEQQQPVPVGIPGELYLGGIQVAIGYLGRPELNAEKFIADPFQPGQRLYRTGDRVRHLRDGSIEFLGRVDEQVKWRGFRIEPGEIETALGNQPGISQAVVIMREDIPGDKRLVAYVVSAGTAEPDSAALKHALQETLPDYMVPQAFVTLDALPLTPSGKVARRRLPTPEYSRDKEVPYVGPRNPVEVELVKIWADVLGTGRIGINDDFFALGGHSLLATKLVARVRDQFGISLPLKYIFRYPSPATLGETVATLKAATSSSDSANGANREEFRI